MDASVNASRTFGVDGCRAGWIAASWEDLESVYIFQDLRELWGLLSHARLILIDIPIGLPDAVRECDRSAKQCLGTARSRVFFAPPRAAVNAPDYPTANADGRRIRGQGLSKQFWMIGPKVRQADELLRSSSHARGVIRECHPEICFYGLAGGRAVLSKKKTAEGYAERIGLLEQEHSGLAQLVEKHVQRWREKASRDDVVDAFVAAWAAAGPESERRTLPPQPNRDDCGLPIEMVYRLRSAR